MVRQKPAAGGKKANIHTRQTVHKSFFVSLILKKICAGKRPAFESYLIFHLYLTKTLIHENKT